MSETIKKQRQNLGMVFFTEESAMTEPAWQGAGTEPGLKIWRIVVGYPPLSPQTN